MSVVPVQKGWRVVEWKSNAYLSALTFSAGSTSIEMSLPASCKTFNLRMCRIYCKKIDGKMRNTNKRVISAEMQVTYRS